MSLLHLSLNKIYKTLHNIQLKTARLADIHLQMPCQAGFCGSF